MLNRRKHPRWSPKTVVAALALLIVGIAYTVDAQRLAPRLCLAPRHASVSIFVENEDHKQVALAHLVEHLRGDLVDPSAARTAMQSLASQCGCCATPDVDRLLQDTSVRVIGAKHDRCLATVKYTGNSLNGAPLIDGVVRQYISDFPTALAIRHAARMQRLITALSEKHTEYIRFRSRSDSASVEIAALHREVRQVRLNSYALRRTSASTDDLRLDNQRKFRQEAGARLAQRLTEQGVSLHRLNDLRSQVHDLEQQLTAARQQYQQATSLQLYSEPVRPCTLRGTAMKFVWTKVFIFLVLSAVAVLATVGHHSRQFDDLHDAWVRLGFPITEIRIPECVAA